MELGVVTCLSQCASSRYPGGRKGGNRTQRSRWEHFVIDWTYLDIFDIWCFIFGFLYLIFDIWTGLARSQRWGRDGKLNQGSRQRQISLSLLDLWDVEDKYLFLLSMSQILPINLPFTSQRKCSIFNRNFRSLENIFLIIPSQMEVAPLHCTVDITQKRRLFKNTKETEKM